MPNETVHRRYSIIYADPPWRYRTWSEQRVSDGGKGSAIGRSLPYPTMATGDICSLPVGELASRHALLFLLATYPMLPDAMTVIPAWGFTYKTVAFTWVKTNRTKAGFAYGLGYWTRANPEVCLLATRGRPTRVSKGVANLVVAPRREHSRKPDVVRERIVALRGDLPRVELFARQRTVRWDIWGNEVGSTIELRA